MTVSNKKDLVILELNEFNTELLTLACAENKFPSIQRILKFNKSSYKTNDRYNSGDLEPWVQWSSIHTGVNSKQHNIKHPGECPKDNFTSFWQNLSNEGISTGIWGAINSKIGESNHTEFFVPHFATLSETAKPNILNPFLTLPRQIAENPNAIARLSAWQVFKQLFASSAKLGICYKIFKIVRQLKQDLKNLGANPYVYKAYADLIAANGFIAQKQFHQANVNILFLDSLSYLQRHHWKVNKGKLSSEMLFGLNKLDQIFSLILDFFEKDSIIVHNGLSQMQNKANFCYKGFAPKNPWELLTKFDLDAKIYQLTQEHSLAVFSSSDKCEHAIRNLKEIRVDGKKLFILKQSKDKENHLYFKLENFEDISDDAMFTVNNKSFRFFELFEQISHQTSKVMSLGTIFSQDIKFPNHIFNHEFNQYIYHYFMPEKYHLKAEYIEDEKKSFKLKPMNFAI